LDVREELVDRRVVAVSEALDERPRVERAHRVPYRETRERRGQAVAVALGPHPTLADRAGADAPRGGGVEPRGAEHGYLVGRDPTVDESGVRDEAGEPSADDRTPCRRAHLTEPASRPCTKYRWKAKKTASGTISEMNEAGAIRSMFAPNWRRFEKIA